MGASTIPTDAPSAGRSTEPLREPRPAATRAVRGGDIVYVRLSPAIERPLIVTFISRPDGTRICGTLFCEPDDHRTDAFIGARTPGDVAQLYGRPTVLQPTVYAFMLKEGSGVREWRRQA